MASLYAQYIKERCDQDIYETETGFIAYSMHESPIGKQLFVHDMYITPTNRRSGEARKLVFYLMDFARQHGCTHAMTTVDVSTKTATDAMKFQISVGMNLYKTEGNLIYLFRML